MWSESGNIKGKNIRRIGEPRYIHRKRTGDRENDKTNSTLENTNSILGKKCLAITNMQIMRSCVG